MSQFKLLIAGLLLIALSTSSIAWIKQIQQKHLNQAQLKRIEIEEFSKNSNTEALRNARKRAQVYLKKLEQTPEIPFIAEPSKQFQFEQSQLSATLEQLDQTLAILESSTE